MNRDEIERLVLLAGSGELSARGRRRLEGALQAGAESRRCREDTEDLLRLARERMPDARPSAAVMARIRAAAEAGPAAAQPLVFRHPVSEALAAAAALVLVAAGWLLLGGGRAIDRIGHMHTIVALVSEQGTVELPEGRTGGDEERLRLLARDLLVSEGLAVEETSESESPILERQPTTLRSRSTGGPIPQTCG